MTTSSDPTRRCDNCEHHFQLGHTPGWSGVCRRFPPQIAADSAVGVWPLVKSYDACGEWLAKSGER